MCNGGLLSYRDITRIKWNKLYKVLIPRPCIDGYHISRYLCLYCQPAKLDENIWTFPVTFWHLSALYLSDTHNANYWPHESHIRGCPTQWRYVPCLLGSVQPLGNNRMLHSVNLRKTKRINISTNTGYTLFCFSIVFGNKLRKYVSILVAYMV